MNKLRKRVTPATLRNLKAFKGRSDEELAREAERLNAAQASPGLDGDPEFEAQVEEVVKEIRATTATARDQVRAYVRLRELEKMEALAVARGEGSPRRLKDLSDARQRAEDSLDATQRAKRLAGKKDDVTIAEALAASARSVEGGRVRRTTWGIAAYLCLGEDLISSATVDGGKVIAKVLVEREAARTGRPEGEIRAELVEVLRREGLTFPEADSESWDIWRKRGIHGTPGPGPVAGGALTGPS